MNIFPTLPYFRGILVSEIMSMLQTQELNWDEGIQLVWMSQEDFVFGYMAGHGMFGLASYPEA